MERRPFIKTLALASASLAPVVHALAHDMSVEEEKLADIIDNPDGNSFDFHVVDNNLLNLHFYFVNAQRRGKYIKPIFDAEDSFMVIRLPQMHVSEEGLWKDSWPDDPANPDKAEPQPRANLSGYSYLAFHLWPTAQTNQQKRDRERIRFSLDRILDWNNQSNFELITLVEWFELKGVKERSFDYLEPKGEVFKVKKIWKEPNGFKTHFDRYRSKINLLLDGNLTSKTVDFPYKFVPITLMEVPQGLYLVPISRSDNGELDAYETRPRKKFWKNQLPSNKKLKTGKRKYEIWNNQLFYERSSLKTTAAGEKQRQFEWSAPSFRAVGLYNESQDIACTHKLDEALDDQTNDNYLPALLDKTELAYLTQYARENGTGEDFTSTNFDLKELNGLFYTGLGIVTHLKYYNLDNKPACSDLIEYEHIITQGRDVFIKVARLGYNTKTGQRYKHVIEGKRKIAHQDLPDNAVNPVGPTSFIELKQYCECIDEYIDYEDGNHPQLSGNYKIVPTQSKPLLQPVNNKDTDFKRNTFTDLTTREDRRIPIRCLQDNMVDADVSTIIALKWFWPVQEAATAKDTPGKEVKYDDYLLCQYEARDWEGGMIKAKTPFMFIRASYATQANLNAAYNNYFSGTVNGEGNSDDEELIKRRKTFFNREKLAFTYTKRTRYESLKSKNEVASNLLKKKIETTRDTAVRASLKAELDLLKNEKKVIDEKLADLAKEDAPSLSKSNVLETDFIEHYFRVKKGVSNSQVVKEPYMIYPQVLKAKVYVDQIRDLAQKSIPSVIDYHEDYVKNEFDDYTKDISDEVGNGAQLILKNTKAFVEGSEERISRTYDEIKEALRQSKKQLGSLAIPDIIPDTISLDKFGITLPGEMTDAVKKGQAIVDELSNGLNKLKYLNPRAILRGKLSDVCGLDLTELLDELLPAADSQDDSLSNETPLFEIDELLNKVEGAVLNSPVYKAITEFEIEDPLNPGVRKRLDALIDDYKAEIKKIRDQLEDLRVAYNAQVATLSAIIPNAEELDHLVKGQLEKVRTEALSKLTNLPEFQKVIDARVAIKQLIEEDFVLLEDEVKQKRENAIIIATDLLNHLQKNGEIKQAQYTNLRNLITNTVNNQILVATNGLTNRLKLERATFRTKLDAPLTALARAGTESVLNIDSAAVYVDRTNYEVIKTASDADRRYFKLTKLDNIKLSGFVELDRKLKDFEHIITKNIAGNAYQEKVAKALRTSSYYQDYKTERDAYLVNARKVEIELEHLSITLNGQLESIEDELKNAISKGLSAANQGVIREAIRQINTLVSAFDLLRRLDPYFYFKERIDLEKRVDDIENRFKNKFHTAYLAVKADLDREMVAYEKKLDAYRKALSGTLNQSDINQLREDFYHDKKAIFDAISIVLEKTVKKELGDEQVKQLVKAVEDAEKAVKDVENNLKRQLNGYKQLLNDRAKELKKGLDDKLNDYLRKKEAELSAAVNEDNIREVEEAIAEAKNLYRLITSIKQKDLSYTWNTNKFRDYNLGIVKFKKFTKPDTTLSVDVKSTAYFTQGEFPPAIDRIVAYSENRFSNFGVTFFNALTVDFKEVVFTAGTDRPTDFDVQIKDVKFDGALSFVQAFEAWLKTIGKGLILELNGDHVSLGYSFPVPSIVSPAFSIFNISINFDINLYFDSRPLLFGFQLSRPESKFGIAAGIFAGFGYFGIWANTKGGVVRLECALEAGVWAGIRLGPISGEVKLAFGIFYSKDPAGVSLYGYIVFEGRLSVWIISVSARVYLAIESRNSHVEGVCTVVYSAKLGFIKKSFSGTFRKHIKGAENTNRTGARKKLATFIDQHPSFSSLSALEKQALSKAQDEFIDREETKEGVIETHPVSKNEWKRFITVF